VTPTLRPYQHQLLADIRASVRQGHRRIVAVMPTGAGKGTTIGAMVASAAVKRNRTLVLAHRAELIQQLSDTAAGWGVPHGVIAAGRSMDNSKLLQVGSVQTVIRRLDRMFPPDIIIVDEAHRVLAESYLSVIGHWPAAKVLGVTATPDRGDLRNLGQFFDSRHVFVIAKAGTAIVLRHQNAHKTQFAQFLECFQGEFLAFVPLHYIGTNMFFCKIAHRLAHHSNAFALFKRDHKSLAKIGQRPAY
jgi:superfamily II DNA or RNA helicase